MAFCNYKQQALIKTNIKTSENVYDQNDFDIT